MIKQQQQQAIIPDTYIDYSSSNARIVSIAPYQAGELLHIIYQTYYFTTDR